MRCPQQALQSISASSECLEAFHGRGKVISAFKTLHELDEDSSDKGDDACRQIDQR